MPAFRNSNLELVHSQPAEAVEQPHKSLLDTPAKAAFLGAAGVVAAAGAFAAGEKLAGTDKTATPNKVIDPTTHVEVVAQPGDTLNGIAADIEADGKTTIPLADVQKYLKTEANPEAPGVNPDDAVLQVGEKVVGDVPVDRQAEAQLTPPAEQK